MGLEVLIPILMGALFRAAGRISDGVLDAVQEQAKDTAERVFDRIRLWWTSDEKASSDLRSFEHEPETYSPVLEKRLADKLVAEPNMQTELEAMVRQMGPAVNVFQDIANSKGITGAQVEELTRGQVNVKQVIKQGENVIGAKINKM